MALSVPQNLNSAAGVGSLPCSATQAGSTLVVCVTNNAFVSNQVTDNAPGGSNTYVEILAARGDSGNGTVSQMFYSKNAKAGVTVIGFSPAPTFGGFFFEITGTDAGGPLDGSNGLSSQSGATVSAPSILTKYPSEVVVANSAPDGSVTGLAGGSTFTINGPNGSGACAAYKIVSGVGTYQAQWTQTGGPGYGSSAASFTAPNLGGVVPYVSEAEFQWGGGNEF